MALTHIVSPVPPTHYYSYISSQLPVIQALAEESTKSKEALC